MHFLGIGIHGFQFRVRKVQALHPDAWRSEFLSKPVIFLHKGEAGKQGGAHTPLLQHGPGKHIQKVNPRRVANNEHKLLGDSQV